MLASGGSWYARPRSEYTLRSSTCWIAESSTLSTVVTGLTNQRPFSRTTSIDTEPLAGVVPSAPIAMSPNGMAFPRSPDRQSSGEVFGLTLVDGPFVNNSCVVPDDALAVCDAYPYQRPEF